MSYDPYPVYFDYRPYVTYSSMPNYSSYYAPYYGPTYYEPVIHDNYFYTGYVDPYYATPYYYDTYYVNDVRSGIRPVVAELLRGLLGQAYLQGLYAGQYARAHRLDDDDFYDPYVYDDVYYEEVYYVPYAPTLDEQRRYLSEGYRLGYRDAMLNRNRFDVVDFNGDVDLVSLMIGSTLNLAI